MKLLAFDTSTHACSASLFVGARAYHREEIAPRRHAALLLPMVDALLTAAGVTLRQLDALAFGRGPGAFTGIRLAAGMAQGLALGADLPVIPVSSLALLAQGAAAPPGDRLAIMDARMGEVYWAWYAPGADGAVQALAAERVTQPEAISLPAGRRFWAVGSGACIGRPRLEQELSGQLAGIEADCYPLARNMLPLARLAFNQNNCVSAAAALPVYLRNQVAAKPAGKSEPRCVVEGAALDGNADEPSRQGAESVAPAP